MVQEVPVLFGLVVERVHFDVDWRAAGLGDERGVAAWVVNVCLIALGGVLHLDRRIGSDQCAV